MSTDKTLWDVWHVFYQTYAEILTSGDKKRELVAKRLTFKEAKEMVERLGFGYSMHETRRQ